MSTTVYGVVLGRPVAVYHSTGEYGVISERPVAGYYSRGEECGVISERPVAGYFSRREEYGVISETCECHSRLEGYGVSPGRPVSTANR